MGLLGASFEDKVRKAVDAVRGLGLGVADLGARVDGKVVTLEGTAHSLEAKTRAMEEFNARVETGNTVNRIRVVLPAAAPPQAPAPAEAPAERWHVVVAGDTLGGLAERYYGKAGAYMRIFEANTDQLKDPNLIKVGQKLRIPS
ncbi:MAG: LysM peptidoglycan-binding domain-containing protein [Acidobacteriota bacterium]